MMTNFRPHSAIGLALVLGAALAHPAVAQQSVYEPQARPAYPQATPQYHTDGQSVPAQSYPQQAYPQQAYPQQAYPQQAYPQQAYPQQPYAGQSAPPSQNPFRQAPPETYDYARYSSFQDRGRRNMAEGDIGQAEDRFAEALEINPFDPVSLNNLAVAKAEQGDYHTAKDLLERAGRLDEGNATITANLARLRGWLNTYAGNELRPRARVPVPVANQAGGLPPPPPPLWDPRADTRRIISPSNERFERTYTPGSAYRTYSQPGQYTSAETLTRQSVDRYADR